MGKELAIALDGLPRGQYFATVIGTDKDDSTSPADLREGGVSVTFDLFDVGRVSRMLAGNELAGLLRALDAEGPAASLVGRACIVEIGGRRRPGNGGVAFHPVLPGVGGPKRRFAVGADSRRGTESA